MELQAATRLLATTGNEKLRNFIASLTEEQQDYFFNELPYSLTAWFTAGFSKGLQLDDVVLAARGLQDFKKFIIAMSYIRQIFPITVTGMIYRLTSIEKLPTKETVVFKGQEQFRALTSWTTNKNPIVESRAPGIGRFDVVLAYKLPNTKNVLFDYKSIHQFVAAMVADQHYYITTYGLSLDFWESAWTKLVENLIAYEKEHEVALYLNPGQSIKCTWREVSQRYDDEDDEYED